MTIILKERKYSKKTIKMRPSK